MVEVGVAIDVNACPRQTTAIDQAGVVQGVAEHGVAGLSQRSNHGEIGDKSAAKHESGFGSFPSRQSAFEAHNGGNRPDTNADAPAASALGGAAAAQAKRGSAA